MMPLPATTPRATDFQCESDPRAVGNFRGEKLLRLEQLTRDGAGAQKKRVGQVLPELRTAAGRLRTVGNKRLDSQ